MQNAPENSGDEEIINYVGFHMTFGDGLELERKTNYEHFQTVQSETIAQRRAGILERGRKQT